MHLICFKPGWVAHDNQPSTIEIPTFSGHKNTKQNLLSEAQKTFNVATLSLLLLLLLLLFTLKQVLQKQIHSHTHLQPYARRPSADMLSF